MKRVFLAIKIPHNKLLYNNLTLYRNLFNFAKMRWIDIDKLHMTLKFFGPIPEDHLNLVHEILSISLKDTESFKISINKLGIFGSSYSPQVLWMGIKEEEFTHKLFNRLQKEFDKISYTSDRQNFVPHITIARISNVVSRTYFQQLLDRHKKIEEIELTIDSIHLLESIISKNKGASYKELFTYKLK